MIAILLIPHGDAQLFQKRVEVRTEHARFFRSLRNIPVVSF